MPDERFDPLIQSRPHEPIDLELSAINDVMFRWARGDLSDDDTADAIKSHLNRRSMMRALWGDDA